ncbi:MAG: hypothetical protein EA001_00510 [Oscillatoriales cyanobacterium]|nr:MAG: hypothetical protein EA001_00510 [Oscillatoriales cyanobacterium]
MKSVLMPSCRSANGQAQKRAGNHEPIELKDWRGQWQPASRLGVPELPVPKLLVPKLLVPKLLAIVA